MFDMENQSAALRAPRKRRSLAQELVTVLTEQIRDGQLKRGDKLPTESAIMDTHGVSRTVVREAISRLQAAGQVETRHGIGTFVLDTPSPSGFRIDPATVVTLSCGSALRSNRRVWPRNGVRPSSWRRCVRHWMR